ncbi:MAG TPA: response regulator, partial [Polyangia bacterium]|nr:response regulator [Polyangia bacterium]
IRECVQLVLEEAGYDVVTAANGAEAETLLADLGEAHSPCVMLLDLMMPVMTGWELLEHLRRDGKLADGMRVVVLSAAPSNIPIGPVACMSKPVPLDKLLAAVRRYC